MSLCHRILLLFLLGLASFTVPPSVLASPVSILAARQDASVSTLVKRYYDRHISGRRVATPGPASSDFASDDEIRRAFIDPGYVPYVFWTEITVGSDGLEAQQFADHTGDVVLTHCFPEGCICRRGRYAWFHEFIDRISGIFADHASGRELFLVTTQMTGNGPRRWSTWRRVESPTLYERGYRQITLVNANNFDDRRVINLEDPDNTCNKLKKVSVDNYETNGMVQRDSIFNPAVLNWSGDGDMPIAHCPVYTPPPPPQFTPGQCGLHISQTVDQNVYPYPGTKPLWPIQVTLKDGKGAEIGSANKNVNAGEPLDVTGLLPYVFIVTPGQHGSDDSRPLSLAYAGWSAVTAQPACSVGKYDHNIREMDCGFPC